MNRHVRKTKLSMMIVLCFAIVVPLPVADVTADNGSIISPEEAAKLAAQLANDKFQEAYGYSPFKPESYTATFVKSRWYWGKIDPAGIGGCSAEVELNRDGSGKRVRVAFHTDQLDRDRLIIKESETQGIRTIPEIDVKEDQGD